MKILSGDHIVIEERPDHEMTHVGEHRIAAKGTVFAVQRRICYTYYLVVGISCWNPAFDVTPASLIAGIITEKGVYRPQDLMEQFGINAKC